MASRNFFYVIAFFVLCMGVRCAWAGGNDTFKYSVSEHVTKPYTQGSWDIYLLGYGWHSPAGYSEERRQELNTWSYGAGAGKRWSDANGNEDLLYAFAFLDSHKKVEPIAGYARQWFTAPIGGVLSLGAGFTLAITAREDILHYFPLPIALPIISAKIKNASLMATVVPRIGSINRGTTVLAWARYSF